jgi:hypothetical protein
VGILNDFSKRGQNDRVVQPDPETPYYVAGADVEGNDLTFWITVGEYAGSWYWTGKAEAFGSENIVWDQGPYSSLQEAVTSAVEKAVAVLDQEGYVNDVEISAQVDGETMN